jgi:hypothetical protein
MKAIGTLARAIGFLVSTQARTHGEASDEDLASGVGVAARRGAANPQFEAGLAKHASFHLQVGTGQRMLDQPGWRKGQVHSLPLHPQTDRWQRLVAATAMQHYRQAQQGAQTTSMTCPVSGQIGKGVGGK